jgi:hypothetical protein
MSTSPTHRKVAYIPNRQKVLDKAKKELGELPKNGLEKITE